MFQSIPDVADSMGVALGQLGSYHAAFARYVGSPLALAHANRLGSKYLGAFAVSQPAAGAGPSSVGTSQQMEMAVATHENAAEKVAHAQAPASPQDARSSSMEEAAAARLACSGHQLLQPPPPSTTAHGHDGQGPDS